VIGHVLPGNRLTIFNLKIGFKMVSRNIDKFLKKSLSELRGPDELSVISAHKTRNIKM
jgi:hypothetical protein